LSRNPLPLLVDGGVLNNLPAGVIKTLCGSLVVAPSAYPFNHPFHLHLRRKCR